MGSNVKLYGMDVTNTGPLLAEVGSSWASSMKTHSIRTTPYGYLESHLDFFVTFSRI
jgi:hypothetical protein